MGLLISCSQAKTPALHGQSAVQLCFPRCVPHSSPSPAPAYLRAARSLNPVRNPPLLPARPAILNPSPPPEVKWQTSPPCSSAAHRLTRDLPPSHRRLPLQTL